MNTRLYTAESTFYKNGAVASVLPVCVGVINHCGAGIVSADLQFGWIACREVMKDGYERGTAATMTPKQIKSVEIVKGDPKQKELTGTSFLIADTDDNGKISYAAE